MRESTRRGVFFFWPVPLQPPSPGLGLSPKRKQKVPDDLQLLSLADAPRPSEAMDSTPGGKRWRNTASKGVGCPVMGRRRGDPFASADVPHGALMGEPP